MSPELKLYRSSLRRIRADIARLSRSLPNGIDGAQLDYAIEHIESELSTTTDKHLAYKAKTQAEHAAYIAASKAEQAAFNARLRELT